MDQPLAFVYQKLSWTTTDDTSAELGGLLAEKVSEVMQTNQKGAIARRAGTGDRDRNGVIDDEWYSVLFGARYVGTLGILLEHSFHINYRATLWLYNDDNLKKLAKEEAEVIYDYFSSIKPKELTYGDINNDGLIDSVDSSSVLSFYSYLSTNGTETDIKNGSETTESKKYIFLSFTERFLYYYFCA